MTVSYSIEGGGLPSAPVFHYIEGETSQSYTLTSTPAAIQVDSGSSWSVTPNPLYGSSSSEQWESSQALSGTASATSIVFTYQHQYYLKMQTSPSSVGSVTPNSGWQNAAATPQIQATPSSGYFFSSWTGSGSGSYSGISNPVTITMNGPITETANFVSPTATLTPTSGSARASVTVSGSNFAAGDTGCSISSSPTGLV
jgi:hypothetical protein